MTNRILAVLLALSTALLAQEPDRPATRVYDLTSLAVTPHAEVYGEDTGPVAKPFSLLGSTRPEEGSQESDSFDEQPWAPADLVIEVVRTFVGDVKGIFELDATNGGLRLLSRMNEADQKTVARVIEQIRASGEPPIEIDVRHLTIDDRSLDEATRALLLVPGKIDEEQLAALARLDVRGGRQGGMVEAALGRWAVYREVRELRYVPDFDVEIAQGAAIPDPVPQTMADGLKVAVRPFLLRDSCYLLRVVASMGDRSGPRRFDMGAREVQDVLRLRNTDYGEIEQCDYQGGVVSTEMVVVPGKPSVVVLASDTNGQVRWDLLALTVKTAPRAVTGDTFAVTPVGALVAQDPPRTLAWNAETGELSLIVWEEGLSRMPLDELVERIDFPAEMTGEFKSGSADLFAGSVLLRGPSEELRKANDRIATLESELIRPAMLEVRLMVESPKESRTVGMLSAPVTLDRKAALASYLRMDTVGDYDVEVAQESRIADPVHIVATAGAFANVNLSENFDGGYRLDLGLVVSAAPQGIRTSEARAGGVPLLQTVQIAKRTTQIRIDLAPGRPRTIELGTSPFGADGRLVAVITVESQ